MRIQIRLTIASLALLALVACGTSDAAGQSEVTDAAEIQVVVDIFSGVPNPTWTVRGSDSATLIDLINGLEESGPADGSAGMDLGFRGFVLRGLDLPGGDDQVRVFGSDVVISHGADAGRLFKDENRSLYTMLRTMSEEHLAENVLQAIPVDGVKGS